VVEIACVVRAENVLGEGPWWDHAGQTLWWIDAWGSRIWRHIPHRGLTDSHALPAPIAGEPIGSVVLDTRGRLVCAMRRDFWRVDLERHEATPIAGAERDRPPTNRLNDGKCDRAGRYWCGSLNTDWSAATGALYRLDPSGEVACAIDQHGISNGIAFSPDDTCFYFADTRDGVVWQFAFDLTAGTLSNRRSFIDLGNIAGRVDGATVDADGFYWCALFGAGAIARFDPKGRLVRMIELPTRDPTMCTFGGADLDTLYVTTARRFLDAAQLRAQPLAGAVFAVRGLGVKGLVEPRYRG
jgi:sugar lactone lactonase YvrE